MKRIRFKPALIGAATGLLLLSSPARASTLIYSNDVLGDIEPCGCRSNPLGGMSRRENWLDSLADPSRLIVDSGNLLFESKSLPALLRAQAREKARVLVKAMNETKLDFAVPGAKDFALGFAEFRALEKQARYVYLAANVTEKSTGKNAFRSHGFKTLRTSAGKDQTVVVVGLMGPETDLPPELAATPIDDAIARIEKEVEASGKKVDLWIALTHQGYDADEALAKRISRFQVIVGSGTESFLQKPEKVEKTLIFQTSFRNQYMGKLSLDDLSLPAEEIHQLVGLDESFLSKKNKPNSADRLIAEYQKKVKSKRFVEDSVSPEKVPAADQKSARFSTFPQCSACHLDVFRFWLKTPHAHALEVLAQKENLLNLECLTCHSLGLDEKKAPWTTRKAAQVDGKPMGIEKWTSFFSAEFLKVEAKAEKDSGEKLKESLERTHSAWAPIQCENCHKGAEGHPSGPTAHFAPVTKERCLRCHTLARAPTWYDEKQKLKTELFQQNLARIRCPQEKP